MQTLGRKRGGEGFGHGRLGRDRIELGLAVTPVEAEGGPGQVRVTPDHDLAGEADPLRRGGQQLGQALRLRRFRLW